MNHFFCFLQHLLVSDVMSRTVATRTPLSHTVTTRCNNPQGENNRELRNNHKYYQPGGCAKTLYNMAEIILHILHIARVVTSYNIPVDLLMSRDVQLVIYTGRQLEGK